MTFMVTANLFPSLPLQKCTLFLNKPLVPKLVSFSSSSSSKPVIVEQEILSESESVSSSSRGCKACGREEVENGCNGEGRIQGGIATVPGFGWWPIKAYRPCPGFLASGGRYRRYGQSMDEVASGQAKKPKRIVSEEVHEQTQDIQPSKKKKQGARKFKR